MNTRIAFSTLTVLTVAFATSCSGGDTAKAGESTRKSTAPPTLGLPKLEQPASWSAAKAELGKQLFFDTRLSSNGKMSCSTCHEPEKGWTDGQRFSTKVDGKVNTRNSPSLLNVAYQPLFYWDGRADTLEKNVEAAWKGHMGGDPEKMAAEVGKVEGYAKAFKDAFGGAPSGNDMVTALASFVRTLQSGGSLYDAFSNGDKSALTAEEQAGMAAFNRACMVCHVPQLFTDHKFHNVGIGMEAATPDPGRHKVDETSAVGSFKTPSLRSVNQTAPYFHDGSAATLKDAVTIMAHGGKPNASLDPLLAVVKAQNFTDKDIDAIVAFLKTLEGSGTFEKPTLPK